MAPLTILHLCSLTRWNGTVHLAAALARGQAAAGHRVIVGARAGAALAARLAGTSVERAEGLLLRHGLFPAAFAHDVWRIRRCLREERVDVVHAWQSAETWVAAAALPGSGAALFRTRSIVKSVRDHGPRRLLDRLPGGTFATCSRIEGILRDASRPGARIFPLREGVDLARFHPARRAAARAELENELGLAPGAIVVLNVGRLEPVKGQALLLRALALLPANVVGVIAGEGSEREALATLAGALGLAGRVHLLGRREDVSGILAAADVYVLASTGSEGSSRATLEAMAAGVATIAADVGMLPDLVEHDRTGLLFPAGDEAALAARLGELVRDPGRRAALGAAARAHVEAERSEAAMLADVERAYLPEVRRARSRARRPLDPRLDWDESTRFLECDARTNDLARWLAGAGCSCYLGLADPERLPALRTAAGSGAALHAWHGDEQARKNNAQVLVLAGDSGRALRRARSFGGVEQILVPAAGRPRAAIARRRLAGLLSARGTIDVPRPPRARPPPPPPPPPRGGPSASGSTSPAAGAPSRGRGSTSPRRSAWRDSSPG
ncbi:MAG: glycosyltransferase [Planctomycetota bacterium]